MTLDEYEAIRLADGEGLYHDRAAARMNVSRQTFGRIIGEARGKIADVLVNGKALRIEGGRVSIRHGGELRCRRCRRSFATDSEAGGETCCPRCQRTAPKTMLNSKGEEDENCATVPPEPDR